MRLAVECRSVCGLLLQRIKDSSLIRVHRGNLEYIAVLHGSDVHRVIEVQRSRGRRGEIFVSWKLVFEKTRTCDEIGISSA